MRMLENDRNCAVNGGDPRVVQRCRARRRGARRLRGRTAENRSRCPTRTTAVEAADSLASGGRSSDEKQNNKALGTGKEGEEGLQEHEHQRQRRFGGLLRVQREKWRSRQKCDLKAGDSQQKRTAAVKRQGWGSGEETYQLYSDGRRRTQRPTTEKRGQQQEVAGAQAVEERKAAASVLRETGVAAAIAGGRGSTWSEAVTRDSPRSRRARTGGRGSTRSEAVARGSPPRHRRARPSGEWQRRWQRATRREGPTGSSGKAEEGKAERAEARRSGRG